MLHSTSAAFPKLPIGLRVIILVEYSIREADTCCLCETTAKKKTFKGLQRVQHSEKVLQKKLQKDGGKKLHGAQFHLTAEVVESVNILS